MKFVPSRDTIYPSYFTILPIKEEKSQFYIPNGWCHLWWTSW
uniref:Uncharacterized protein n=1 Tax=Rhizophora mucronata TaxID=61149 RepID=A0A2P2PXH5_RHIMU